MEQPKLYTFIEDLLWCPSQIYYYFISNNRKFCIYLRWRYRDPWTAYLVECEDNWEFCNKGWKRIELNKDYKDEEYKELEEDILNKLSSMFPCINFPYNSKDITLQLDEEDINL